MESQIDSLCDSIDRLEYESKKNLKNLQKKHKEIRKSHPEKYPPGIECQTKFMHSSSTVPIPIQNWKRGTVFHRDAKTKPKISKNIHSAAVLRHIATKITEEEMDFVLNRRYELANRIIPITRGIYTLVPTK